MITGVTYQIDYNGPDDITFVSLRNKIHISAMQIQSLKYTYQNNFYVLRHQGRKLKLLVQFTGFYQLLADIKAANPAFETYGI